MPSIALVRLAERAYDLGIARQQQTAVLAGVADALTANTSHPDAARLALAQMLAAIAVNTGSELETAEMLHELAANLEEDAAELD